MTGRQNEASGVAALRARLKQSEWIVCSEALRILDDDWMHAPDCPFPAEPCDCGPSDDPCYAA